MSEEATTTLLPHAAREGDVQCVRELMEANDDSSLPVYKALILAVERGHVRVVRYLLGHGADANTISDEGRTVLELAAGNGHTRVVRCLLEYGADLSDAGSDVWTPLVLAIENGHEDTARYLVERGADVNSTDYAGRPMLSVAVDMEQEEIVRYLVNNGAGVRMPGRSDTAPRTGRNADDGQAPSGDIIPRPEWCLRRWDLEVDRSSCLGGSRFVRIYRNKWLNSDVVVKEVASDSEEAQDTYEPCPAQSDVLQRFKREVRRWFRLNHPHVVQLFGACCDDGLPPTFVCEYATNGPLDMYLKAHPEQLWSKLHEVALGVHHLHERGIVLDGLKCSNVVVGGDLKAKVAGFRHCRARAEAKRSVGAVQEIAPELLGDNIGPTTLESDIFSLGMCVIEAMRIVEADMFAEESFVVVVHDEDNKQFQTSRKGNAFDASVECQAKSRRRFSSLPDRPVTCTDNQWALVEKMCAHDPRRRLNIGEVVRALERLQFNRNRPAQPAQESFLSFNTFNDGELMKRWGDAKRLMEDRAYQGLQKRVFQDLRSIFARLQQSVHPRCLLEEVALLFADFLRADRFLRCRVLDPRALELTSSMRVFGRRVGDVLAWLDHAEDQTVSGDYSYRQIDFLVSEDLATWLLLSEVTSDADYATLHSFLKAELFGNASSYTFDQLVVIRSAYEEIDEITLLNRADSLMLRPRWFVRWSELQLAGWSGSGTVGRAKWLGAEVMVKRLERRSGSAKAAAETTAMVREKVDTWFSLSHPNVVRLYGACHVGDPFLICEDASNGPLNEYLREHRGQLWQKLLEAARGVAYLHARIIVHGHLRSSSIVVAADGVAKLTDVGLGSTVSATGHDGGGITGGWRWAAPECREGQKPTVESDVFSLGVCIVEALRAVAKLAKDEEQNALLLTPPSGLEAFLESDTLPSRPQSCRDNEWELTQNMCAYNPSERIEISAVVEALETLSKSEDYGESEAGTEVKQAAASLDGCRKRNRISEIPRTESREAESKRRIGEL